MLEKTLESLLDCKEIQPVHPKGNQSWIFIGKTDAEVENPILWPPDVKNWLNPWYWERLEAGEEGDDRGWDGWMALLTRWTWVWVGSGSWWWAGSPVMLQSMGSQSWTRLRDWTELNNWTTKRSQTTCDIFVMFTWADWDSMEIYTCMEVYLTESRPQY